MAAAPPTYTAFPVTRIPTPIPEITDLTPAAQAERLAKQKADQLALKEAELKRASEEKGPGLLGKLSSVAEKVAHTAHKEALQAVTRVQKQALQLVDEFASKRFGGAFPHLASEPLLGDYACRTYSNNVLQHTLSGYMDITTQHLCFVGDRGVNFEVALADIVSIQLGVSLPTENQGAPLILQLPAPQVIPTVIQVYTRTSLHQFGHFNNFRDALNVLDHAVRAVNPLPVAGVEYS
eukprot:RCo039818